MAAICAAISVPVCVPAASAHVIAGTETLVHIAEPGVEITFLARRGGI